MTPLPLLVVQLLLAVGAALLLGNLAVVFRHRFASDKSRLPPRPSTRRLAINITIGAVVTVWAGATLLVSYS